MDFKQLEAFVNVAKFKSFSKAAENIYLSQPTISSHITNLEKELNIKLFDRTSKEVNLTPAGKYFLEYAINIINTKNNAISHLSYFNKVISGTLSILASTTPCNSIVSDIIIKCMHTHPHICYEVKEFSSGKIVNYISNFDYEIGFIGIEYNNDKISTYKLLEDELVIISNPSLNLPAIIDLQYLKNQNFIMREKYSATRTTIENTFKKYNLSLNSLKIICEVNSLDILIELVKSGAGISIISKYIYEKYYKNDLNMSIIKNISIKRNLYLIINSSRTLSPCANAFLKLCSKEYNFKI